MRKGARPLAAIGVLKELYKEGHRDRCHDLLIVKLAFGNGEAKALVDSGATHNFASEDWVRKAQEGGVVYHAPAKKGFFSGSVIHNTPLLK